MSPAEDSVMDAGHGWSNNTTFSEAVYLQTHLGVRYRSLAESLALSVVYAVIFVTGVVGNMATCVVIVWNAHMHTATNYYLFSLAISDTIILVIGMTPVLYEIPVRSRLKPCPHQQQSKQRSTSLKQHLTS